jgi:hypothetical protein
LKDLIFHEENEIEISRWNEVPTFLCLEDYVYILKILKEIFPNQNINLSELMNKHEFLIHDNEKFHQKNQTLKEQLTKFLQNNSDLQNEVEEKDLNLIMYSFKINNFKIYTKIL